MAKNKPGLALLVLRPKYPHPINFFKPNFDIFLGFENIMVASNKTLVAIQAACGLQMVPSHRKVPKVIYMVLGLYTFVPPFNNGFVMLMDVCEWSCGFKLMDDI